MNVAFFLKMTFSLRYARDIFAFVFFFFPFVNVILERLTCFIKCATSTPFAHTFRSLMAPTRMEVKCFLFAAFFLVACVAFSSQDELTDVEGKSKSTLFFCLRFIIALLSHPQCLVQKSNNSNRQQQFIAQRKARSQIFFYFASMLRFFSHSYFDFFLFFIYF